MAISWRNVAAVALAGVLASGCLIKQTAHTWYLEPMSGEVTWTVLEQDVRSDANTQADRTVEEVQFWNSVQASQHSSARAFRELGAPDVRTRVLRDRVPYSVVTDATFATLDELGRRLIAGLGLTGTSILERDGELVQWTMTIRDPHAEDAPASEAMTDLVSAFETLRVVLADGRFESAEGFTLDSDRRVARFEEPADEDVMILLQLRWGLTGGRQ